MSAILGIEQVDRMKCCAGACEKVNNERTGLVSDKKVKYISVSYTHLDVYKRQVLFKPTFLYHSIITD